MDQELLYRLGMMERQAKEVQEKLEIVEKQLTELQEFNVNLSSMQNSDEKEMFASLGKGVFMKTDIKDKDLFVDVGAGVIIKKTPEQTKTTIDQQIKGLIELKIQLTATVESFNAQLQQGMTELQSQQEAAQSESK